MLILCFIDLDRIFYFMKMAIMGLDQKLVGIDWWKEKGLFLKWRKNSLTSIN